MSAREGPSWGLAAQWAMRVERALAATGGEDEVLETLALASAAELVPGMLESVEPGVRRRLVARGAALLLASSRDGGDSDPELARSRALWLAREGLEALRAAPRGEGGRGAERPATRERAKASTSAAAAAPTSTPGDDDARARGAVAPALLRQLLEGRLDGFAAAELARRARASTGARVELAVLARHPGAAPSAERGATKVLPAAAPRLRLVADDAPRLRDPAGGAPVGSARSGAVELEAVRFDDGVVAIYAAPARRISVPVLPPGVKVVRTALGYVELDVRRTRAAEVDVAVGSHRVSLTIR